MTTGPRLSQAFIRIVSDLKDINARFALVGGLAVSTLTEPRFTRDIDLAIAVESDSNAELIVRSLQNLGYVIVEILEQTKVNRLATVRLDSNGVVVDLLFGSSGIESEIVESALDLEILDKLRAPVACVGHMIAMKVLSSSAERPQDEMDLTQLILAASETDRAMATAAVEMIVKRGFNRGKNLIVALDKYLAKR